MRVKYRYGSGLAEYENDQVVVGRGLFLGIYWVIRHKGQDREHGRTSLAMSRHSVEIITSGSARY